MNQVHSHNYSTREGVVMPAPYRRNAQFCSNVTSPERAGDTKLTASAAAHREEKNVNVPTRELIAAAKDVLAKASLTAIIVVDSRAAAVAVLYGISGICQR